MPEHTYIHTYFHFYIDRFNVMNSGDVLLSVDAGLYALSKYMKTSKKIIETFQAPSATCPGYILS
jgi:hypothetical protein